MAEDRFTVFLDTAQAGYRSAGRAAQIVGRPMRNRKHQATGTLALCHLGRARLPSPKT